MDAKVPGWCRRILAIDPGNEVSGWVELDLHRGQVVRHGNATPNAGIEELLGLREPGDGTLVLVEILRPRGQPLWWQLIWTAIATGRMLRAWGGEWDFLFRADVKHHLTGRTNSADANVNAAVRERWGGDKTVSVGTKSNPGPLYGLAKHAWPALAVAVAYAEGKRSELPRPPTKRNPVRPGDGDEGGGALVVPGPAAPRVGKTGRPLRRTRRFRC